MNNRGIYTQEQQKRLDGYAFHQKLFDGNHFDAFNVKVQDMRFTKHYEQLRYVVCNFAGLISKVSADLLFSEQPTYTVPGGDQEWVDAILQENNFHVQNYESALGNSALGDALYKIRIGKRSSVAEDSSLIIEDITPSIYFPVLDSYNVRQEPDVEELSWIIKINDEDYLRKEVHSPGLIRNELYKIEGSELTPSPLSLLEEDIPEEVETGVNFNLLYHTPNWKTGSRYFGISDYSDLEQLMFALNNRVTKIDNILDKHSDPILMVPEGVLDEKGHVDRSAFHMFEKPAGGAAGDEPKYIVWNASLEAAFDQIEKLSEFLFMFSEVSPDVLGMGKGQSDSGRALKLKLLRTIAKVRRKRLYYDMSLSNLIYEMQVLAQEHNIKSERLGRTLIGDPVRPSIEWQDGLPVDEFEQTQIEEMRLNAGLSTVEDSIQRLEGIDEASAIEKARQIESNSTPFAERVVFSSEQQEPEE